MKGRVLKNGYNNNKVKTSMGEVELDIPHNIEGTLEYHVLLKYTCDISDLEDKVTSMCGRGMFTIDTDN